VKTYLQPFLCKSAPAAGRKTSCAAARAPTARMIALLGACTTEGVRSQVLVCVNLARKQEPSQLRHNIDAADRTCSGFQSLSSCARAPSHSARDAELDRACMQGPCANGRKAQPPLRTPSTPASPSHTRDQPWLLKQEVGWPWQQQCPTCVLPEGRQLFGGSVLFRTALLARADDRPSTAGPHPDVAGRAVPQRMHSPAPLGVQSTRLGRAAHLRGSRHNAGPLRRHSAARHRARGERSAVGQSHRGGLHKRAHHFAFRLCTSFSVCGMSVDGCF